MAHDTSPVHTPIARVTGIGIALAAMLGIILLAFMWPTITSSVKGIPVAIAGPGAHVEQLSAGIVEMSPDTFEITPVVDRAAAVELIETREAYGAIVLGQSPEILTASAASAPVAAAPVGKLLREMPVFVCSFM